MTAVDGRDATAIDPPSHVHHVMTEAPAMRTLAIAAERPTFDVTPRVAALIAGIGLLLIAVLAGFARFGVMKVLVVPGDAATTIANLVTSEALFRVGIAAFLLVIILDILLSWALYVVLEPVHRGLALLTAWLRLAFAAVFASSLVSLLDSAQMLTGASAADLASPQLQGQVMASLASFDAGFVVFAHAIFGVCNLGLGYLVFRSTNFPRFLGLLLAVAGAGYLADAFGTILIPAYSLSIGSITFLGEALLIVWLVRFGIRGEAAPRTLAPGSVRAATS